jgi:GTPase
MTDIPVIALVGRPNVGKSSLFNRMTKTRDALVANLPGLTRDRKYGEGEYEEKRFIVIDTGGLSGEEEGIDGEMAKQSLLAMQEATIVLFVVDARDGLMPADEMVAHLVRSTSKPCHLVVNKIDGLNHDTAANDFFKLGFESVILTAASQNRGITSLQEEVLAHLDVPVKEEQDDNRCRIGVVGRPNVGKSTLVNRMLGEERVVVFDQPGTTRDSIYIPYERNGTPYTLIDTAGVRRRKNVKETVEKFSIVKTLQAVEDSNVVILVIDARESIVDQDLHLIGFVLEAGRALVIAVNKWDGMTPEEKADVKQELERRLIFLSDIQIHFISAKFGSGVGDLYKSIDKAYKSAFAKWQTKRLTELLADIVKEHQPPMVQGRRIKLRFAHQGGSNPPIIVIHGTKTESVPDSYKRYLENSFRKALKISGTPIRFEFKTGENPFAEPKLTDRERARNVQLEISRESGKSRKKVQPNRGEPKRGEAKKSGDTRKGGAASNKPGAGRKGK